MNEHIPSNFYDLFFLICHAVSSSFSLGSLETWNKQMIRGRQLDDKNAGEPQTAIVSNNKKPHLLSQ